MGWLIVGLLISGLSFIIYQVYKFWEEMQK